MKISFLYVLALAISFAACSKLDKRIVPQLTTFNINLLYAPNTISNTFELIISSSTEGVLLDTMGTKGTILSASLKSRDTLVDLTTIYYEYLSSSYVIRTYTGVNPSNWNILIPRDVYNNQLPAVSKTKAHLTYINLPKLTPTFAMPLFEATAVLTSSPTYSLSIFEIDYDRHPTGTTYLMIPDNLLCKFHTPKSNQDTVDLSQMDTVYKINFNRPSQYKAITVNLRGILDSTDLTKEVGLYSGAGINFGAELLYPKKQVQQYQLSVTGLDQANNKAAFFSYGNTLPSTLPFPDDSYYSITKNQGTDFSISFLKTLPAYYLTVWRNTKIIWAIYASPGTTQFQPETLLGSFHSQLLKNTSLTNLKLSALGFEITPLLNYNQYFEYALTTNPNRPRMIYSSIQFTKDF